MTDDAGCCSLVATSILFERLDVDRKSNTELFEPALNSYRRDFGKVSEDLDKMIARVLEDTNEIRGRLDERDADLHA